MDWSDQDEMHSDCVSGGSTHPVRCAPGIDKTARPGHFKSFSLDGNRVLNVRSSPHCCRLLARQSTSSRSIQSPSTQLGGWSRPPNSPVKFRPRGVSGDNPSTGRPALTLTTLGRSSTTTPIPHASANTLAQLQFGPLFFLFPFFSAVSVRICSPAYARC